MIPAAGDPAPWSWREWTLGVVLVCGMLQAVLTYGDVGGPPLPAPLEPRAARGLALWRRHNCQACHQLFGFGGFLGPDLTNVAARAIPNELEPILDQGRKQMPAFGLSRREQRDLFAFFEALDAAGQSQPDGLRNRRSVPAEAHFERLIDAAAARLPRPVPDAVRRGVALIRVHACGSCHVPLTVGRWSAPDWTVRIAERPTAALLETLRRGRNAMPAFELSDADGQALLACMQWMAAHRELLRDVDAELCQREVFAFREVPWFEYR